MTAKGRWLREGTMKPSRYRMFAYVVASTCAAACEPRGGALVAERWSPLAIGEWSLDPGSENARWCTEVVADETYISALRPIASPGTHHIALNLASLDDDGSDCTAGQFGPETIYVSGPATEEVHLPPGVAMKVQQGQLLDLNLHVYNATSQPLHGVSGIEVVRTNPEAVTDEAGFVLLGPDRITLAPRQRTTIAQTCGVVSDQTAVALIPLMHKYGVSFKTTVTRAGESTVLYEGAFQFEEQTQVALGALALRAGDTMTVECTYDNPTYGFITKGHQGGEICYSALLRFPSDAQMDCAALD
jgi:hypothetical protein